MRPRTMTMTRHGRPTHLINQNKHICLSHHRLIYISNVWVVRASKLTNNINLDIKNKVYNPAEVLIESDESDVSDPSDFKEPPDSLIIIHTILACPIRTKDTLDKLCGPCIKSKLTQVIRCNKSMTVTTNKLEELHANLWGSYNPLS